MYTCFVLNLTFYLRAPAIAILFVLFVYTVLINTAPVCYYVTSVNRGRSIASVYYNIVWKFEVCLRPEQSFLSLKGNIQDISVEFENASLQ